MPIDPWTRGSRVGTNWVGDGAVIHGSVENSVIGAGAVVPEGAILQSCVVWDGVTVGPGAHNRAVLAN